MIDERERFERAFEFFEMPEPAFERLVVRRDRKRRNERLSAGAVAIAIAAVVGAVFGRAWLTGGPMPADTPTPTPGAWTRFESPFYGYSISVPAEWSVTPATTVWTEGRPRRSDVLNASGAISPSSGFSFNILIASIEVPGGMSAEAWQLREEAAFEQMKQAGTCGTPVPSIEPIEFGGVSGRLATACDLFATFVVEGRGYVVSTRGPALEHLPLVQSVLATIRFEPERAVPVQASASAWRGIWPQTTRQEAGLAQARADANGVETAWQVDWNQEGTVPKRFVEEVLGWRQSRFNGVSYVPGDAEQTWEAEVVEWYFIRCEPDVANPLYPDDRYGTGCAPTIDETHFEQVVVRTEQLVRQARSGISIVTGWEEVEPYVQVVPPSDAERAEALSLIDEFMQARVSGVGAEGYLGRGGRVFFLNAMSDGRPYARYEIGDPGSEWAATWPSGGFGTVVVRLLPETGGGCVIQRIGVEARLDKQESATGGLLVYQFTGFSRFKGEYEEGSVECTADLNTMRLPG